MWGPGWWGPPMWGFWWIFPLIGLAIAPVFVLAMVRFVSGGGRFMFMGGHERQSADELSEIRREIHELGEEVKQVRESR